MGFGVFIHRADSVYDDRPFEQYQFPRQYLARASECLGNWIVYYEPVKVLDSRGYYAIAKIEKIIPDPSSPDMYLALIESGSYLEFVNPVPFNNGDGIVERGLLNDSGKISGRAQFAVRSISTADFNRIIELGLDDTKPLLPRSGQLDVNVGFSEEPSTFIFDEPRSRVNFVSSRIVRDRVFRKVVLKAYDERCAISGLKLIDGGGRAEVDAAHIRPVEANGPDIVSNGIALSGTAHWMFDRGLISLTNDFEILISRQANDPDGVRDFINKSGRAYVPNRLSDRPHSVFLAWHRDNCYKR